MDALLVVATIGVVWIPVHAYLSKTDLADLRQWVVWVTSQRGELDGSKKQFVEDEMQKLRCWNYQCLSRFYPHIDLITGLALWHQAIAAPDPDDIIWAIVCTFHYFQHLAFNHNLVELTPSRLKYLGYLMHTALLVMILSAALAESCAKLAVSQSLHAISRVALVLTFLDPSISIPFQVLFTAAEILACFWAFDLSTKEVIPFCLTQLFMSTFTAIFSLSIDSMLKGRICALLETADAESLVSSFQRMLHGVCDGEVLLDSDMKVAQESEGLKHLILTNVTLVGRSFQRLLADEERDRFNEFIETSTQPSGVSRPNDSALPSCLRVSFRDSAGIKVAADIYHVPVPGLFGAKEPHHLMAFKEDPESRQQPEAEEHAVPAQLLDPRLKGKRFQRNHEQVGHEDCSSMSSGSTGRSSCANICPELQDMTLMVDADTELHDVQQAELNFKRNERPNLPSGLQSSMPSLRKLLKPTDWEKVRSQVARFVEMASASPSIEAKVLRRISLQLPGQNGWLKVEEASIHQIQGSRRILLHLSRFSPEKATRSQPSLCGIEEGIQDHTVSDARRQ